MGIKQFLGIKWIENKPKMLFYDDEKKEMEYQECRGKIELQKTKEKRCKGYYDLKKRQIVPCKNYKDLSGSNYSQCIDCQNSSGFALCLGCTGDICRTKSIKAKNFCNEEHFVYLAYFSNDKFKVGTAASYRKYERLLEQGAIYSIFIAKTENGRLARKIEKEISKLGVTTRVNSSYKIKNFIINRNSKEIEKILIDEYKNILKNMTDENKQFFINPEYNEFSYINDEIRKNLAEENIQLNLFGGFEDVGYKEYDKILNPEKIKGIIKVVIGNLVLLEDNDKYSVVNMKSLEGYVVEIKKELEKK